ncbi:MAG: dipeptidase [Spirochaetia bacterium]|jgi:membrane dipeptidase|nr:dipeptidase [Spirochaetia bacterium]
MGCADRVFGNSGVDKEVQLRADGLVHRLFLADSHIDYPERYTPGEKLMLGTSGNFDYPRARKGGLDLAFIAAFVSSEDDKAGKAYIRAQEQIKLVEDAVHANPQALALVSSPEDARRAFATGKLGLAIGMENAAPLDGKLERIAEFMDRGVSYITLTHVEDNHVCDSSGDRNGRPLWNGLSPFGREVVTEMNRLGLMVDVSHASDKAFWQVLELSRAPVIASHTGCRSLTPGFERNMTDEMMAAIGAAGGVVQIAFGSMFIIDGYQEDHSNAHLTTVKDVAAAVDHAVQVAGVHHVGIGSDFDGVGSALPKELADVSMYANLVRELMILGYSDDDLEKILGGHLLRVWTGIKAAARA